MNVSQKRGSVRDTTLVASFGYSRFIRDVL